MPQVLVRSLAVAALLLIPAESARAVSQAPRLRVSPPSVTLVGPKSRQSLLVQDWVAGGYADLTGKARFVSSDPKVAVVGPGGTIRPVGDGSATISVLANGRKGYVGVRVRDSRKPFRWSFVNHVQSVLTRSGCNSGACHGAAAGKGGLKLSLRGYDNQADYHTLTRQALGRRVNPREPAKSLLLLKPTMGIPHAGGARFKPNSAEYGVLHQWISAGAPGPQMAEPVMTRLEVFPQSVALKPGQEHRVVVRAVFSDGHTEDATRWTKFGSSDSAVATVDDEGRVKAEGHGEAAITLWYLNKVAFARVGSPYPNRPPEAVYSQAERFNFIDDGVLNKLRELGIRPAGLVSDEQFIRRAYLDAAGILPTPEEVEQFVGSREADKRAKLVHQLLQRPEFTDYWTHKWSDLLLVSSRKLPTKGMWSYYNWIRESVAENKPWDRFVREMITASGSTLKNGAANYYVLHKDPIDLTETTSQAFLGMSLTCARCHNHPLEKWTQDQYYGMANLFGRVRMKNGDTAGETLVFSADQGEVVHPRTGVPMPPTPLDAAPLAADASEDRRAYLARWLTGPENPYFAKALVNRVWRNFMGRGLVEAEDDLRLTNPPSNGELFEAVTADFIRNGYDVRKLIRTIMTSAAYQRSPATPPGGVADQKYYSTYITRRLSAEVLLDAISQVTGVPSDFPGYPRGYRALQLADSQVASAFLTEFGRAPREQTCSCERQEEPSVSQALHLANGDTINAKLRAPTGAAAELAKENLSHDALLDRLMLRVFARKPRPDERARVAAALRDFPAGPERRREVIEDLFSAMLTSKEFLFNH